LFYRAADVDDVVGDNAEANPAVHSVEAFVAAAIETVSPLDHADAPLASGPPFLPIAEPALLLLAFALTAFAGAIGNAHALDAHRLRRHGSTLAEHTPEGQKHETSPRARSGFRMRPRHGPRGARADSSR